MATTNPIITTAWSLIWVRKCAAHPDDGRRGAVGDADTDPRQLIPVRRRVSWPLAVARLAGVVAGVAGPCNNVG